MGGFSDEAIEAIELAAEEDDVSMYATEVMHLREVYEQRGHQISAALTEIRLLESLLLELTDRMKYYNETVKAEDVEHLFALTKTARRTLE